MQLASDVVGAQSGPLEQAIDARWLMAYSAGLGETDPRYYDTAGEVLAHPLFAVCYEWPATHDLRVHAGLERFNPQLVHAQHDLIIHRKPRAEKLSISGQIVAAMQRRPGALVVFRMAARDGAGAPVSTTDFGVLYRGVQLAGADRSIEALADPPVHAGKALPLVGEIAVSATAAHVYTECARIWNPIHTDAAYARAAGLPGIILHGTATLALSVSRVLAAFGADPAAVRRVQCRFSGMVLMPSTLAVFASHLQKSIHFETRTQGGEAVISRGSLLLE